MKLSSWLILVAVLLTISPYRCPAQTAESKFSAPPVGYDKKKEGIERGKVELVEYDSKTVAPSVKLVFTHLPGLARIRNIPFSIFSMVSEGMRTNGRGAVRPMSFSITSMPRKN